MTQLIVNTADIAHNLDLIKKSAGDAKIIGVVKANGYGLGMAELSRVLLGLGIDMLAVSRIDEAELLRDSGIDSEILLLSPTAVPETAGKAVDLRLTAAVGSIESGILLNTAAAERNSRVKAHIKIDCGFGRYGFLPSETDQILKTVSSFTNVDPVGIFAHLSSSFGKREGVMSELGSFIDVAGQLARAGFNPAMRHIANSCATLRFPETRLDAVRVGSALVGRLPVSDNWGFRKAGRLASAIDNIKYLPAGHTVGYAGVYKTRKPTRIAVISAGYADGIIATRMPDAFRFSDRLRTLRKWILRSFRMKPETCEINGKRAKILGRIGATSLVADVTGIDCSPGDSVYFSVSPVYVPGGIRRVYV